MSAKKNRQGQFAIRDGPILLILAIFQDNIALFEHGRIYKTVIFGFAAAGIHYSFQLLTAERYGFTYYGPFATLRSFDYFDKCAPKMLYLLGNKYNGRTLAATES